jgi:hypothetical protein
MERVKRAECCTIEHVYMAGMANSFEPLAYTCLPIVSEDRREISVYDIWRQECLCTQFSEFPFSSVCRSAETATLIAGTEGGVVYFFKMENFTEMTRFADIDCSVISGSA